jgi:hypothetical protein
MDVKPFEYSVALANGENVDLVTLPVEVIRPPNGMRGGQIGQ